MTEFSQQVSDNLNLNGDKPESPNETETQRLLSDEVLVRPLTTRMGTEVASSISISSKHENTDLEKLILSSEASRMGYVAAKGTAGIPMQALHALANDLENPENLAAKVGGGFAFGVGMRTVLPKSGAGRAIAGSVFVFWMIKDAMVPVKESMTQAWDADSMQQLEHASNIYSGGLGHFAYDSALTIGAANVGERVTERAMRGFLGNRRFSSFEATKEAGWNSAAQTVGRGINSASRTLGGKDLIRGVQKPTVGEAPKLADLNLEARTREGLAEFKHHVESAKTYTKGVELSNGERIGLSETLFLLEKGKDPRALSLAEAKSVLESGQLVPLATVTRKLAVAESGKGGTGKGNPTDATGTAKPLESKPTAKESLAAKIERETNPESITAMSKQMTEQMAEWNPKSMAVADRVEGDIGPVVSALKTQHKPLDGGYGEFGRQMFLLADQVKLPEHYQQVGTLFGYARDASNQYNLGRATQPAELAQSLNLLSREIHTGLKEGLRRAGVKPEEVLNAKNPPLFTVRNDGGAGPHTIPEINGIWDVDVVLWPRNMIEARSTAASGINGHEIGHNQYGGLLKFEDSIRDSVIGNAVSKGLESYRKNVAKSGEGGKIPDSVEVPGHGSVSKQELYEGILKAQANENTADIWGTAWTGPNSGLSLGVLLQSLRTGGKLETRNVMGKEFIGDANRYGFEVHGIDRFRVKLSAEVLRQRANGDPLVLEYAKSLDRYAESASREGDYVWASLDHPGKNVTVPKAEFEAMIPHLVRVQLNQPLPALKGKTFGEILPDLPTQVKKMNELADIIVDGAKAGREPSMIPFDVNTYTINQVFGSGMPAQLRLMADGMSAKDASIWVNRYSDHFRGQYLEKGNPHVEPIGKSYKVDQLKLDPGALSPSVKSLASGRLGNLNRRIGQGLDRHAPSLSGYMGGTISESIFTTKQPPNYLDISRLSVMQDAEEHKKVTDANSGQ